MPADFQGRLTVAFLGGHRPDPGPGHGPRHQPARRLLHEPADRPTSSSAPTRSASSSRARVANAAAQGRPVVGPDNEVDPRRPVALDRPRRAAVHRRPARPGRRPDPLRTVRSSRARAVAFVPADRRPVPDPPPSATGRRPDPRGRPPVSDVGTPAATLFEPLRGRGHASPTRTPSGRPRSPTSPACWRPSRLFALGLACWSRPRMARRFTTPLRRLTEASRGLAEGDLTRRVPASAGPGRFVGARPSSRSSSTPWPTGSRRASRSSAATATGAATSWPTCRTSCAPRWPRCARSTSCSSEGAADDPEARAEFLESSGQQIERLDWLAQNLLELSKLDSGLVLLDLRPDDLRAAVEIGGRAERRRRPRAASRLTLHLPDAPDPDPPRPAADRPGRGQPRRQRDQVHAARRLGVGRRGSHRRTAPGSRSSTPASASTPPSCRTSSSASTAARGRTRRAAAGAGSGLAIVALDRGHARRHGRGRERVGSGLAVHRPPARATRASSRARRPPSRPPSPPRRAEAGRRSRAATAEPQALIGNMQETSPSERSQVNPEPAP